MLLPISHSAVSSSPTMLLPLSLHSIMFSCTIYFNCNVLLHFNYEDGGSTFIWYVNMQLPEYTAGARRPQEKSSVPWKSHISNSIYVVPLNSVQDSLHKAYTIKVLYILIFVFFFILTWMVVKHSPNWICTELIHECNTDLFTVIPKYQQRICYLVSSYHDSILHYYHDTRTYNLLPGGSTSWSMSLITFNTASVFFKVQ